MDAAGGGAGIAEADPVVAGGRGRRSGGRGCGEAGTAEAKPAAGGRGLGSAGFFLFLFFYLINRGR